MKSTADTAESAGQPASRAEGGPNGLKERWWRVFDVRIGTLPLPVYVVLIAVLAAMSAHGKLASDLPTGIALVAVGGFTCAELAKRIPWIRHVGATSIFTAFIPSMLVYYKIMPEPVTKAVTAFTKQSNFLYLFIAAIIVGSVLSMDRQTLVKGFVRIFVPVAAGSVAAAFLYLWWLSMILFDLSFVWHRYIRRTVTLDAMRDWSKDILRRRAMIGRYRLPVVGA